MYRVLSTEEVIEYNKRRSIAKGKAYAICFAFILGGIMLSELCRRVL